VQQETQSLLWHNAAALDCCRDVQSGTTTQARLGLFLWGVCAWCMVLGQAWKVLLTSTNPSHAALGSSTPSQICRCWLVAVLACRGPWHDQEAAAVMCLPRGEKTQLA